MVRNLFLMLAATLGAVPAAATTPAPPMLIIAHRGASGERPEHTLAAYERAIDQGADYIEPDLVVTKDNILVARHENEISGTTDVADRPEFAARRRSATIDGTLVSGWFVEDFTLAELRTLRARERLPVLRPGNARFDGLYSVPTFAEIVQLVRAKEAETGRRVGLYPELKHPTFLMQQGFDVVDLLVTELRRAGLAGADAALFIQCFEVGPLRRLDRMVDVPLVQLVAADSGPADEPALRYAEMLTPSGLGDIATYADAVGADLRLVLHPDGTASSLVADAARAGLTVHAWTVRKENAFLPAHLRSGTDEGAAGRMGDLVALLRAAGVAGIFTDDPAPARENGTIQSSGR